MITLSPIENGKVRICKVVNEIKSKCPVLAAYYAEKEKKK
jgi:hypothetical protein